MTAAVEEAERLGDVELRDRAMLVSALFSFFEGRSGETVKILDDLIDRAPTMSRRARQQIAGLFGICAYFGSLPLDEAFAALDRVYVLQGDSPTGEAQDLRVRAGLLGMAGRFEEAHAAVDRSVALFDELGIPNVGRRHESGHRRDAAAGGTLRRGGGGLPRDARGLRVDGRDRLQLDDLRCDRADAV